MTKGSRIHGVRLPKKQTKPQIEADMLRKRQELGVATLSQIKKLRILENKGY